MAKKIRGFSKVTDEFNVNLREYVGLRHVGLTRSLQHRRYAPQGGTETAVMLDLRASDRRVGEMAQMWRKRAGNGANKPKNGWYDGTTLVRRIIFRRTFYKQLIICFL